MTARFLYLCCVAAIVSSSSAFALTQTSVAFTFNGRSITRDVFCEGRTPGTVQRGKFTPLTAQIRTIRKANPKSKRIALLIALLKVANRECALTLQPNPVGSTTAAPTISVPTATPQPTSIPTAMPTAIPTATPLPTSAPADGNFDALGNTTPKGNASFQIPAYLTGNVTNGKNVVRSYCTGCHIERVNRSYPEIDQAIRKSPMLYDENSISRQQLADLVAYLNRFKL